MKRQKVDIIGVTGSVGKTTATLAIYKVLERKYKTGMTFKEGHGLNSETGIPFAILDVHVDGYSITDWLKYLISFTLNFFTKEFKYEKYVVEMGVDKPKDMELLLSMIKPDIGVFLSISKVHTEYFEEMQIKEKGNVDLLDLVFNEKNKLIKSLKKENWAVLNFDQKKIIKLKNSIKAKVITFGLGKGADVRGEIKDITANKFKGIVVYKKQKAFLDIRDYFVNKQVFSTLLSAISVGILYDISLEECIEALKNFKLPPGRMSKIKGIKNTLIIDSSYNASKLSVFEALDNLLLFKDKKKVAVLGDMRELGKETRSEHEAIVKKAIRVADEIVLIGPAMKNYFLPEAVKQGFIKNKIHSFLNTWKAFDFIKRSLIKGGEVILVKGSQNTLFLEIIVEGLMKDKSKVKEILCRRGEFWERKRRDLKQDD